MLLLALLTDHTNSASSPLRQPNFLFVMADDQGWGDVAFNNVTYPRAARWTRNVPQTPHLDEMSRSPHTIVFNRFYAGSAVCSPTRAAVLTGRSPDRECIWGPEPHGWGPAWSCSSSLPLPPTTTTIAEAAKAAGYATLHAGKWHLGEFFPKKKLYPPSHPPSFAYKKWPVSSPAQHGFSDFHSTEASAATSVLNCGCEANWKMQGDGCIVGGGTWTKNNSFVCENYWYPSVTGSADPACRACATASRECVQNLTQKIAGDDTAHIIDTFAAFLDGLGHTNAADTPDTQRTESMNYSSTSRSSPLPFLALLWLHTVHEPHAALPEFYHGYRDAFGDPARDYLGSITQMDVQIGRLRQLLRDRGIANSTMLWYTSDNGPHPKTSTTGARDRSEDPAYAATSGLRQCKASLYEGGIRVPGLVEWPAAIGRNVRTWHPAYVSDYMPTLLDILNMSHPHPSWAADGMSLLPLIKSLGGVANGMVGIRQSEVRRPHAHPLVFKLGNQAALIDGDMKVLENPSAGHCDTQPGGVYSGIRMFNLSADPTETHDLSSQPHLQLLFQNLTARLAAFKESLVDSAQSESLCLQPKNRWEGGLALGQGGGLGKILPQCTSPFGPNFPPSPSPAPPAPPPPPPPLSAPFTLKAPGMGGSSCLTVNVTNASAIKTNWERASVVVAPCRPSDATQMWRQSIRTGQLFLVAPNSSQNQVTPMVLCPKPLQPNTCTSGMATWLGHGCEAPHGYALRGDTVQMIFGCSPALCLSNRAIAEPCNSCHGWKRGIDS